jgi:hypothetical protein
MLGYVLRENGALTLAAEILADPFHPIHSLYNAALKVSEKRMNEDFEFCGSRRITRHAIAHKIAENVLVGRKNGYTKYMECMLSKKIPFAKHMGTYLFDDLGE